MNGTILIVEDEARIARWVQIYLEKEGFETEVAHDGETGLERALTLRPDLIILDLMLPKLNGIQICHTLRQKSDVPIIMLTAKGAQSERLKGLDYGADDYIVKPFDVEEVVSRCKAVLRRVRGKVRNTITCGLLTLDEASRTIHRGDIELFLSHAQFSITSAFMRHPNQVLSRNRLIEIAFANDFDAYDRAIDTYIRRLRRQIHIDGFQPIQTVYGAGYKFVTEECDT